MDRRTRPAAAALAGAVLLLAAGCGGGGKTTTTTTAAAAPTTTTTAVSAATACKRLNAASKRTVTRLGSTLGGFTGISSLAGLSRHTTALQRQIRASTAAIAAVQTPPGPLTRDRLQLTAALQQLTQRLAAARKAAAGGRAGTAAKDFGSLAQLGALRHAAASLARDCPAQG